MPTTTAAGAIKLGRQLFRAVLSLAFVASKTDGAITYHHAEQYPLSILFYWLARSRLGFRDLGRDAFGSGFTDKAAVRRSNSS